MSVTCRPIQELREYNIAARIHNQGDVVGLALEGMERRVARRLVRERKMVLAVEHSVLARQG